jgi:HB1, ASXL, restriction endonuclease HTH domain
MARSSAVVSWSEAITQVLRESATAMHYNDIASQIATRKLRPVGANPASSVATALSISLSDDDTPFVRVGRGEYSLREVLDRDAQASGSEDVGRIEATEGGSETGALRAFGMYWKRDAVWWAAGSRLLGQQNENATSVNFAEQVGVYILYDRDRVIYVGRADQTLFSRLRAHVTDRLGGRWDRFSWFGLRGVSEEGSLTEPATAWSHKVVVDTLEALLIEAIEPPQNRKGGDNFRGLEYLQVVDPDIKKKQRKQLLDEMARAADMD